jgi:hypothetical protein
MKKTHTILFVIALAFSLMLSACNLPAAPTLDPVAQQATIDAAVTQAMGTAAANLTSTAAALPTSTSTAIPTEEPTATQVPTATAVPPTATRTYAPPAPTRTLTPTTAAYACKLISTSPTAGTKITTNGNFDAVWKVQNVGTKVWEVGYLDLKYISGQKMQTVADIFDVSTFVDRGGELTLIVDMKSPSTVGKYTASWALVMEGVTMCTLPVDIEAVAP